MKKIFLFCSFFFATLAFSQAAFAQLKIGFSIKADIKNPQPGCTTKVTAGYISLVYQN